MLKGIGILSLSAAIGSAVISEKAAATVTVNNAVTSKYIPNGFSFVEHPCYQAGLI